MILLMVVAAIATDAMAQKSVLKAFDKVKEAEGVIVEKVNNVMSPEPGKWQFNVVEFRIPMNGRKHIARVDEAFTKESKGDNVTYYVRMKALGENPTDAEKEAYKKIQVKYDHVSIPITIGLDPSYHTVVLRYQSGGANAARTVVAMEWKMEPGFGCLGRFYEIKGRNETLWEEPLVNPFQPYYQAPVKREQRNDNIATRMHFYRDTFDGEDNSENSALLLNMTEYLNTHWEKASEAERNMVLLILQDMAGRSKAKMHRDLINQCGQSLKDVKGTDSEIVKRMELYIKDFRACSSMYQKDEVLKQVENYVSAQVKSGMDAKTANEVYEQLLLLKRAALSMYQKDRVAKIVYLLEKE